MVVIMKFLEIGEGGKVDGLHGQHQFTDPSFESFYNSTGPCMTFIVLRTPYQEVSIYEK